MRSRGGEDRTKGKKAMGTKWNGGGGKKGTERAKGKRKGTERRNMRRRIERRGGRRQG